MSFLLGPWGSWSRQETGRQFYWGCSKQLSSHIYILFTFFGWRHRPLFPLLSLPGFSSALTQLPETTNCLLMNGAPVNPLTTTAVAKVPPPSFVPNFDLPLQWPFSKFQELRGCTLESSVSHFWLGALTHTAHPVRKKKIGTENGNDSTTWSASPCHPPPALMMPPEVRRFSLWEGSCLYFVVYCEVVVSISLNY